MRIVLCYPVELRPSGANSSRLAWGRNRRCGAGANRLRISQGGHLLWSCQSARAVGEVVAKGKLQWIQSSAAGMDHCLTPAVVKSEIPVTSASGVLAKQVADHTMALLAGMLRDLPTYFRARKNANSFADQPAICMARPLGS